MGNQDAVRFCLWCTEFPEASILQVKDVEHLFDYVIICQMKHERTNIFCVAIPNIINTVVKFHYNVMKFVFVLT